MRRLAVGVLLAFAATFLVLHHELARGARFVPDDLCQRADVAALGVLRVQRQLYQQWSGRWVSSGIVASAMAVLREPSAAFPYALGLLAFAVAVVWTAARALVGERVRAGLLPLLAVVTVAALFFATPHRGDSWFFVFSSIENLVPLCAALLALACARHASARSWLVVPGAFLAAVATGGHEAVALPVLATGAVALIASAWRDRRDPRVRTGATMLAIALLSFVVSAASPGSSARLAQMPRTPLLFAASSAATGGPGVLLGIARDAAGPLLVLLLAWAVGASSFAPARAVGASSFAPARAVGASSFAPARAVGASSFAPGQAPVPVRRLLAATAAVLLLAPLVAFAATFSGYYALGEPPPTRAQLVLAVFLVVAAVEIGSLAGAALRDHARAATVLVVLLAAAVVGVGVAEIGRTRADIALAHAYAAAYDARVAFLRSLPREPGLAPVVVDPLPPSGVLRSAEISADTPAAFENRCWRRMLQVGRPVLRAPDAPPSRGGSAPPPAGAPAR
ncbi:MAG: hypothetical protein FJ148_16270 [Deltaproteobacteria bacterium]|nr:hypothetical protein [Deltaproteobacteria bacterium]